MTTYIQTTAIQGSFTILTLWILCENDNIHPNYSYTRLLHYLLLYEFFVRMTTYIQTTASTRLLHYLLLYEFFVRMTTYIQTTAIQGSFTILLYVFFVILTTDIQTTAIQGSFTIVTL